MILGDSDLRVGKNRLPIGSKGRKAVQQWREERRGWRKERGVGACVCVWFFGNGWVVTKII